jgi:hypothetical protein
MAPHTTRRRRCCALLLLATPCTAFAPATRAARILRAAPLAAAAQSPGESCRCEATEAFRRGLDARFALGTLTAGPSAAGPGELASILRMRQVLDEPPDAWDALCGEECTVEW